MARYALASHVFVCLNGEHLVFLDLKEDRYWALEAAQTSGLGSLVGGWPVKAPDAAATDTPTPETAAAIEVLRGRGLLTDKAPPGKDATPVSATPPELELMTDSGPANSGSAGSWWSFFTACAFGKIALRTWPFERVIRRVRLRKAARAARRATGCRARPRAGRGLRALPGVPVFIQERVPLRFIGADRISGT